MGVSSGSSAGACVLSVVLSVDSSALLAVTAVGLLSMYLVGRSHLVIISHPKCK